MTAENQARLRPRAAFDGWVEITVDGQRLRGEAQDLSVGGIGVRFEDVPDFLKGRVMSEFALPGIELPLELRSQVAWSDPESCRLGLSFSELDPGLAELLQNFVAGRF